MIQINNGFESCYYLSEDGSIVDINKNQIIKPNKRHLFFLKTNDGRKKYIAQRTLYRIVYCKRFCIDKIQNLNNEIWKEIEDTNGLYYVSNMGRVKSLQGYNAILLKKYTNQSDYDRVEIVYSNQRRSVLVHRLVAQAFLPIPKKLDMQLHHKDFNKHNNRADNLIWLSQIEHSQVHKQKENKDDTK